MRLLDRLFGWRKHPVAGPLAAPEVAEAPTSLEIAPTIVPEPAPLPEPPEARESQVHAAEVDEVDEPPEPIGEGDQDDSTIGVYEPLKIDAGEAKVIEAARKEAERQALAGPHRVTPSDPVGPGSLADVLMALEKQGLVTSQVVEGGEFGFHLLYEPLKGSPA
jgi:hypothetical protein